MKRFKSIIYSVILAAVITFCALGFSDANINNNITDMAKHKVGCKCCDGRYFHSILPGACSGHGGVKYWKYSNGTKEYTGNCK